MLRVGSSVPAEKVGCLCLTRLFCLLKFTKVLICATQSWSTHLTVSIDTKHIGSDINSVGVAQAVFHAYQHMLHHWHAQIRRWTRCSNHAVRRLPVFWGNRVSRLKTTVYQLHGQLTVFSLPPPQWSGQTVHCFRPLRVSRLTHIHTLVLPAQRSSIPRCQFRYPRPIVPSIIFRLRFTLYCFCPFLCLFQPWYFRMQPQTLGKNGMWW